MTPSRTGIPKLILSRAQVRALARHILIQVGIWTFFALVFVPQTYFLEMRHKITIGRALYQNLLAFYPWVLIAPFILWLCNKFPFTRSQWLRNGFIHLLASIPIAFFEVLIERALYRWTGLAKQLAPLYLTLSFAGCFDLLVYWGIVAAGQGIRYYREAEEHEHRLVEAKLQMLRGQLEPHFLFNTMNAAAELVYVRPDAADRVLTTLSELLRMSLGQSRATVSLQEDLSFVRKYMDIQKELMLDRLRVMYEIEPDALTAAVPAMLMQPLVENAVKHGLAGKAQGGTVRVRAVVEDQRLEVLISDDGKGATQQEVSSSCGIGLANVRTRLQQLYGANQTFRTSTSPGRGFSVHISIPFLEAQE